LSSPVFGLKKPYCRSDLASKLSITASLFLVLFLFYRPQASHDLGFFKKMYNSKYCAYRLNTVFNTVKTPVNS